jgi:hypothetical protein
VRTAARVIVGTLAAGNPRKTWTGKGGKSGKGFFLQKLLPAKNSSRFCLGVAALVDLRNSYYITLATLATIDIIVKYWIFCGKGSA